MATLVYILGIILIILGLTLLVFEIVHPGAFMLIPGTVLTVAGFLFIFFPDFITQTYWGAVVLVIVAIGIGLATIPIYRRMAPGHRPMSTTPTSLTGETGLVISPVVPDSMSGKVRVRGEVWSARGHIPIPAGAKVRVVGGEGVCVWVEPETPLLPAQPPAVTAQG